MSNQELEQAIAMTNAMLKAASLDSKTYPILLAHFEELLKEQKSRAQSSSNRPW